MSNQSYDQKVKDILDRVANGHLSPEEATTLIAALKPAQSDTSGPSGASGSAGAPGSAGPSGTPGSVSSAGAPGSAGTPDPASNAPVADNGDPTAWPRPSTGDTPSPTAWAEAVDSPTANPANPAGPAGAAGTPGTPGATGAPGTAGAAGSSQPAGAAGEPTGARHAAERSGVQDSVPGGATGPAAQPDAEEELVEEQHSNVPIPSGVQRVTIRAIGRRVRLIGEPAVNGVAVDGPHVIKRDGDTLAISSEGDMGVSIDGFSMLRNPTDLKAHVNGLAKELSIRVNPNLQVEVEVTGGSVNAERVPGLSRVRVTAGTAKVADVDGPIDVLVQAGTASVDGQITKGRSRVRVESGTATVALRRGSDVRVHTEAQLGRVTWTGAVSGQSKDVEIGRGRAALDVEVLVGTAQLTSD
ncbi:collagen-like protein [Kribbella hippodromi]